MSSNNNENNNDRSDLYLPTDCSTVFGWVLHWKVMSNSPVRKGETLAIATPLSSHAKEEASSNQQQQQQQQQQLQQHVPQREHKRPTKRRRPTTLTQDYSGEGGAVAAPLSSSEVVSSPSFDLAKFLTSRSSSSPSQKSSANQTETVGPAKQTSASTTIPIVASMDGILFILNNDLISNPEQHQSPIGYIVACEHLTYVDGLCVVCGKEEKANGNDKEGDQAVSMPDDFYDQHDTSEEGVLPKSHNKLQQFSPSQTSSVMKPFLLSTVAGGSTVAISPAERDRLANDNVQRLIQARKLNLVLDLDHTLVHATHDSRAASLMKRRTNAIDNHENERDISSNEIRSLILPVLIPVAATGIRAPSSHLPSNKIHSNTVIFRMPHWVKLRPHLREFFESAQPLFEIGVYTAGTRQYAQEVTLLLARHLVRAPLDTPQLEHLRHVVVAKQAEYDLLLSEASQKDGVASEQSQQQQGPSFSPYNNNKIIGNTDAVLISSSGCDEGNQSTTQTDQLQDASGLADCQITSRLPLSTTDGEEGINFASNNDSDTGTKQNEELNVKVNGKTKRKRVSFVDPLENNRNNSSVANISAVKAELTELQEQLQYAEQKEQLAVQLRQRLFGGRIVSRSDCAGDDTLGRDTKSLSRMFPWSGGGQRQPGDMAVIVDDREDVWANDSSNNGEPPPNLLLVRPYHWGPFSGFAEVNGAPGGGAGGQFGLPTPGQPPSQATSPNNNNNQQNPSDPSVAVYDEQEDDDQLLHTAQILRRVHERYFSDIDSNNEDSATADAPTIAVPELVRQMRAEVLEGCHLLLSGLVPLHRQQQEQQHLQMQQKPLPRPAIIRHAENLGAVIHSAVNSQLTHVVAAKDGTEKVLQARRLLGEECAVVQPSWLMDCVWTLTRRSVEPYLLNPALPYRQRTVPLAMSSNDQDSNNSRLLTAVPEQDDDGHHHATISIDGPSDDHDIKPNSRASSSTNLSTEEDAEENNGMINNDEDGSAVDENDDHDDSDLEDRWASEMEHDLEYE